MSQHGTDRFDGYAVGEEHRRGCRVSALMPRDVLGDAATLGDGTDSGKARVVVGNGENPAVPAQTPVFVDDALCDVEQGILDTTPVFWRLMFIHSCSSK